MKINVELPIFGPEDFKLSLRQAVALANHVTEGLQIGVGNVDISDAFRHSELSPARKLFPVEWEAGSEDSATAMVKAFAAVSFEVNFVIHRRRELLYAKEQHVSQTFDRNLGRLLVVEPGSTMVDNISGSYTDGFFDQFDIPPWDLWVAYIGDMKSRKDPRPHSVLTDLLIAFIPSPLVALVEKGIWANTAACLYWLESEFNSKFPILDALRLASREVFV